MPEPVTVAVDANGADKGPAEVARGAALAAAAGTRVLLFGPRAELGDVPDGVAVVDAPVSIAKEPDPVRAVRRTPDASIVRAAEAVADGRADALVSGGSTGAALAAALFRFKRARGVHRPALAIVVPVPEHPFLLLDAGANVEVRAEQGPGGRGRGACGAARAARRAQLRRQRRGVRDRHRRRGRHRRRRLHRQ